MTTNNPRISSYVKQQIFDKIERFCNEQKISRSEGINQILEGFFATQKEAKLTTPGLPELSELEAIAESVLKDGLGWTGWLELPPHAAARAALGGFITRLLRTSCGDRSQQ